MIYHILAFTPVSCLPKPRLNVGRTCALGCTERPPASYRMEKESRLPMSKDLIETRCRRLTHAQSNVSDVKHHSIADRLTARV